MLVGIMITDVITDVIGHHLTVFDTVHHAQLA